MKRLLARWLTPEIKRELMRGEQRGLHVVAYDITPMPTRPTGGGDIPPPTSTLNPVNRSGSTPTRRAP